MTYLNKAKLYEVVISNKILQFQSQLNVALITKSSLQININQIIRRLKRVQLNLREALFIHDNIPELDDETIQYVIRCTEDLITTMKQCDQEFDKLLTSE